MEAVFTALLLRQDRTWFSHLLTRTWLTYRLTRIWPESKGNFSGNFGNTSIHRFICVFLCQPPDPAFWDRRRRPDAQRVRRREELWKRMCQRRGKQSRRVLFEGVGWQRRGAAVEGRGGTVFLFPCLAQLGLVRLQASMGEPSLFPRRCQLPVVVQLHVQLCSGACLSLPMPPSKTLLASPWCGF